MKLTTEVWICWVWFIEDSWQIVINLKAGVRLRYAQISWVTFPDAIKDHFLKSNLQFPNVEVMQGHLKGKFLFLFNCTSFALRSKVNSAYKLFDVLQLLKHVS